MNNIEINLLTRTDSKSSLINEILIIQEECRLSNWTINDYICGLQKGNLIVIAAKLNKHAIGFLAAQLIAVSQELEILNFGILQKHQNSGIGNLLWLSILEIAHHSKTMTILLEVRESNRRAIKFYEKRGFQKIQIRKNYYSLPTENAILMQLKVID